MIVTLRALHFQSRHSFIHGLIDIIWWHMILNLNGLVTLMVIAISTLISTTKGTSTFWLSSSCLLLLICIRTVPHRSLGPSSHAIVVMSNSLHMRVLLLVSTTCVKRVIDFAKLRLACIEFSPACSFLSWDWLILIINKTSKVIRVLGLAHPHHVVHHSCWLALNGLLLTTDRRSVAMLVSFCSIWRWFRLRVPPNHPSRNDPVFLLQLLTEDGSFRKWWLVSCDQWLLSWV